MQLAYMNHITERLVESLHETCSFKTAYLLSLLKKVAFLTDFFFSWYILVTGKWPILIFFNDICQ